MANLRQRATGPNHRKNSPILQHGLRTMVLTRRIHKH